MTGAPLMILTYLSLTVPIWVASLRAHVHPICTKNIARMKGNLNPQNIIGHYINQSGVVLVFAAASVARLLVTWDIARCGTGKIHGDSSILGTGASIR